MADRGIGIQRIDRHITPRARSLHRGPGHFGGAHTVCVDPCETIAHFGTHAHGAPNVLRPNRRGQPVIRRICDAQRIFSVLKWGNGDNGAEHLGCGNLGRIVHIGKKGWFIKIARPIACASACNNITCAACAIHERCDAGALRI